MASMEDAISGLQAVLQNDFPTLLSALESNYADGIMLEPIRTFEWEEQAENAVTATPAVILLGSREVDQSLRDMVRVCQVTLIFILEGGDKTILTKKLYRYARALRQSLRQNNNRTLGSTVISTKVTEVDYGPTFTDGTLFTRAFNASLEVKVVQGND